MKKNCRKCHFLFFALQYPDPTGTTYEPWDQMDREYKMPMAPEVVGAGCYKGIWSESGRDRFGDAPPGTDSSMHPILLRERGDSCFFVEYREGMSFDAAEDLFRLDYDNRQLKKSYRYTQWGLWVAAVGIVVSVALKIIDMLF
ncbi:MAG: hypothetical protein OXC95_11760 [Dehalococcoidia bacterium]|nr:hypothetical protein [Dehalococcoidia bacterium]